MNTSELEYLGELRNLAKHVYSGTVIHTDAPLDNNGLAQSFSPTDLLATSLAACMMTIMGIEARKLKLDLKGTTLKVVKIMASNPRRVDKVEIVFTFKTPIEQEYRQLLENAAHHCPVAKSIHPDIKQQVLFKYPD